MFNQAWLPTPAQQVGVTRRQGNRVKQINGCFHSGTKVKDPVRSTNTHMYAFSCNPNPNMLGASLLRIVRRQGRWRIVVRHPLVLQHAERPLNRWSAHSGTQKGAGAASQMCYGWYLAGSRFGDPDHPKRGPVSGLAFRPPC